MNVIGIVATLILGQSAPQTYDEIYFQAADDCLPNIDQKHFEEREAILKEMIVLEEAFFKKHPTIPKSLRGILIAAICRESRFNPNAKGDWRINLRGRRVAKAIGIVQMWPWWVRTYNIDRRDYTAAANTWLNRIVYHYAKNKRLNLCPKSFSEKRKWIAAWVQTTRGAPVNKANKYRCYQAPTHYRVLKQWIRKIKIEQQIDLEDGC
jgi:hypothetical protein